MAPEPWHARERNQLGWLARHATRSCLVGRTAACIWTRASGSPGPAGYSGRSKRRCSVRLKSSLQPARFSETTTGSPSLTNACLSSLLVSTPTVTRRARLADLLTWTILTHSSARSTTLALTASSILASRRPAIVHLLQDTEEREVQMPLGDDGDRSITCVASLWAVVYGNG
ncbi:hypothetical protein C8Q80DRAFT_3994 [Daedaleopsis nitida]|nr:hypothetical protein C8Q80DRAFT_3994 [Daedaleopsis nitida]